MSPTAFACPHMGGGSHPFVSPVWTLGLLSIHRTPHIAERESSVKARKPLSAPLSLLFATLSPFSCLQVLVTEGPTGPLIKLCDFGFSKDMYMDSAPQTQLGTALFMAPEVFMLEPGMTYDVEAADVWSCGMVGRSTYALRCQQLHFPSTRIWPAYWLVGPRGSRAP